MDLKKILIFLLTSLSILAYHKELRLGTNLFGVYEKNPLINDSHFAIGGLNASVEFLQAITFGLQLGVGIAYQEHGSSVEITGDTNKANQLDSNLYNSIPVFASIKWLIGRNYGVYGKAHFGYSFNTKKALIGNDVGDKNSTNPRERLLGELDIEDGSYFSLGFGVQLDLILLEAAYERTTANVKIHNRNHSLDYHRVSFYVGLRF